MDQNKRLVLFLLLTGIIWFGWLGFIQPTFFPDPKPNPAPQAGKDDALDAKDNLADAANAESGDAAAEDPISEPAAPAEERAQWVAPKNPARPNLKLGSLDPASGYFQEVTVASGGASVSSILLNDPRYKNLEDRTAALEIVGQSIPGATPNLATAIREFDDQLAEFDTSTTEVDWKVERTIPDPADPAILQGIVFSLRSPDGTVKATKTYRLEKVEKSANPAVRDTNPKGYMLDVSLAFENLSEQSQHVSYTLQGPIGLPLENRAHTSKYRELELGFLDKEGELNAASITAADVTEQFLAATNAREADERAAAADRKLRALEQRLDALEVEAKAAPDDAALQQEMTELRQQVETQRDRAGELTDIAREAGAGLERWDTPFRYLGVEVQYFTSLLFSRDPRPLAERFEDRRIAIGEPVVVAEGRKEVFNDISFELTSEPVAIEPGAEVTHSWSLFSGPKRTELLEPLGAEGVLDLGWFGFVSRGMLWILEHLHGIGLPYWLAIICLTVIVRGAMFPISRKQAIGAAKMKELQPKLTELKEKYGKDQEKMLRAQMELFRKHGYGPLGPMASGCMPIVLQLPIFIGLYTALQTSVDLRMQSFLWIDNLAAPDELFEMPFSLPYLGSDFNLLPLITVVLFYIQQKLFMPPATSPEQEAQYKMMNFMMLFMGFFFYHVPAGLCLYFIASSLWSIGERTLLSKTKAAHIGAAEAAEIEHEIEELDAPKTKRGRKNGKGGKDQTAAAKNKEPRKPPGWLERLLQAAESAQRDAGLGGETTKTRDRPQTGNNRRGRKSKQPRR